MALVPPEIVFNFAPGQNHFFVELAEVLTEELSGLGASARLAWDEYPAPCRGRVFVLMPPHEYVYLTAFRPPDTILQRCIGISAEQPTSHHFSQNIEVARDLGAVFDINRRAVREYARHGVEAQHLPLGHTPSWDRFSNSDRDIDVLFMGRYTDRRGRALGSYADIFERYRCHIQFWDNSRPASSGSEGFLADAVKRDLLSRSKVVLSLHGDVEPYFEWLRVAEAISAGCAVVSEHSADVVPLVPGEDFVSGGVRRLGLLCAAVADDQELRDRIRGAAYAKLVSELPMQRAARLLLEAAIALDRTDVPASGLGAARLGYLAAKRGSRPKFDWQPSQPDLTPTEGTTLRALKSLTMSSMAIRRRIDYLERLVKANGDFQVAPIVKHETSCWGVSAARRVTVIVPLFNHASDVPTALQSVLRSDVGDWEMVVVDDASNDRGAEVVAEFLTQHDDRPMRLVQHPLNRGLPHARNTGIAHSTGEFLLMLDADNELRASSIRKLQTALDGDSEAGFAYGIVERVSAEGPEGLLSAFPWNPQRLRMGNYIDALAMIRRDVLLELGGYRTDQRIHGWEDYDLWVRLAEAGGRGAFVPEMVARYQVSHSSMVSVSNIAVTDAYASIAENAPRLMADLRIPA